MRFVTLFFLLSSWAFSADILSVGLSTNFTYSDYDSHCHLQPLARNFSLSAEIEGSQVTRAQLRKLLLDGFSETLELNEEELKGIKYSEAKSELLLTELMASSGMLEMLFRGGSDQGFDKCLPPEKLTVIEPSSFTFSFVPKLINDKLPPYVDSNKGVFHGTTQSGKSYRIEMSLSQELF